MKKVAKAMYGKSMMKSGGASKMKKMAYGGPQGGSPNTPSNGRTGSNTEIIDGPKPKQGKDYKPKKSKVGGATKMKVGGMVNSNTAVSADKTPGSKGVKSGNNPKASASKKAKGKVGGTSKAPKKANP